MFDIYKSRENISSNISQSIIGAPTIIDLHRAINNLANKIDDASGSIDSLTSVVMNSTAYIDDRMIDGVQAIEATHLYVDIGNEDYTELRQQFYNLIPSNEQINFTDKDGNVYSFYHENDEIVIKSSNGDYNLLKYEDQLWKADLLVDSVDGSSKIWFSDLFSQVAESQTLNFVLSSAARLLNSATFTISDFTTQITNSCGSVSGATADLINQIITGFNRSGFAGAAGIIVQYMKAAAGMTVNSSGKASFSFADNSTLVPQEYIVGMIPGIISTVSSAVGLIVAAFNPLIGAAIAGVGYLASAVVNHFISDYSKTLCQYISNDANEEQFGQIDGFPHGLFRSYKSFSTLTPELQNVIDRSPLMLDVPGGYMFISCVNAPGTDSSHTVAILQYEFHPSIHWHFNSGIGNRGEWASQNLTIDGTDTVYRRWFASYNPYEFRDFWNNKLQNVSESIRKIDPINDMTEERDILLRLIFMHNVGLFLLWTFTCGSSYGVRDQRWRMPGFIEDRVNNWIYPEKNGDYRLGDYCISLAMMDPLWMLNNSSKFLNSQMWTWTEIATMCGTTNPGSGNLSSLTYIKHLTAVPDDHSFGSAWSSPASVNLSGRDEVYPSPMSADPLHHCYNGYLDFPRKLSYAIQTPQYNRSTFFLWIAVVAAATAVAIAATVGLTMYGKRFFRRMRAKRIAAVERNWNEYVKTGSKENLLAYEKAVKKNNKLATLIGGTKYSKQGYWINDNGTSDAGQQSSAMTRLYNLVSGSRSSSNTIDDVMQLIHG